MAVHRLDTVQTVLSERTLFTVIVAGISTFMGIGSRQVQMRDKSFKICEIHCARGIELNGNGPYVGAQLDIDYVELSPFVHLKVEDCCPSTYTHTHAQWDQLDFTIPTKLRYSN